MDSFHSFKSPPDNQRASAGVGHSCKKRIPPPPRPLLPSSQQNTSTVSDAHNMKKVPAADSEATATQLAKNDLSH